MRHLDLFSGIGGFALAARRVGWETVAFCEIDPYCQKVLAKHWPGVPIHSDVRELTADAVGPVDIITGGYPCQPFSVAGKRGGAGDDRHLWPEAARLIRELRPARAVFENVAGHITMGLDDVLADLEGLGYACETFVIPACAVDAQHRRDRVWIAAHAIGERGWQTKVGELRVGNPSEPGDDGEARSVAYAGQELRGSRRDDQTRATGFRVKAPGEPERCRETVAHTPLNGLHRDWQTGTADGQPCGRPLVTRCSDVAGTSQWLAEPDVGRVAHGIPRRVDRLRALGNAIVPQVAEMIFRSLPHHE